MQRRHIEKINAKKSIETKIDFAKRYFINNGVITVAMTIDQKRKMRALESKRDSMLQTKTKAIAGLAVVRAELKHMRKAK
jgi:hypothetical protein